MRSRFPPTTAVFALVASFVALASQAPVATAALHPGQYTLNTLTLDDLGGGPAGSYLTCKNPSKQRIVTGGSFWHASGLGPDPNNADMYVMSSSEATFDATSWFGDGASISSSSDFLTITALCLPKSQVGTYTLKYHSFRAVGNIAGGYVKCPRGQRVVTGGAFWHQKGKGPDASNPGGEIGSSSVTFDAKGWYGDGFTPVGDQLTVTALCLPSSRVGNYTLKKETLPAGSNGVAGGYLKCPKNHLIVAGGAFWHAPGKGPNPSNALQDQLGSSAATFDAKGWYADGDGTSSLRLTIVAQCLPK
jgi:hypothetical protein